MVTLRQVWDEYKTIGRVTHSTAKDYEKRLRLVEGWLDLPVESITKDMVQDTHAALKKRGGRTASLTMRIVSTLFNYAAMRHESEDIKNPVKRLSELRQWHKSESKAVPLRAKTLPLWYEGLRGDSRRNFFLFMLLTGCRKKETIELVWENVDLVNGYVTLPKTKNGRRHVIPLSSFVVDMLRFQREQVGDAKFVFPGDTKEGHISIWTKANLKVGKKSGVQFTIHALRHTYITEAVGLEVPVFCIRQLVNHRSGGVTEGYYCPEADNLRRYTEAITASLLSKAGVDY